MVITNAGAFLLFLCILGFLLQVTGQVDGEFNYDSPEHQRFLEEQI